MAISDFFDIGESIIVGFDYDRDRQRLIDNLDYLKSLPIREATLYKKWQELNKDLTKTYSKKSRFIRYHDYLWKPIDIYDTEKTIKEINNLEPIVELCNKGNETRWTDLRKLIHSQDWSANPGRNLKFFVLDRHTKKLLGLISCGSDVTSIRVRDHYIGWKKENKFEQGKLDNVLIASTIVAVQPLGYNFLGGKLIAVLSTCKVIRDTWEKKYNNKLIGVTTTSLYGIHSQYNGIPRFKTLGESAGKILIKPDDEIYFVWNSWLKKNYPDEFEDAISRTSPKQNVLNRIFKHLGIKSRDYEHGFKRGIYFAQMYENGNEYLRNEISDKKLKLKSKFNNDYECVSDWWKPKAIRRYLKLIKENRIKPEDLFYIDAIGISWEKMKRKYLKEIGR